MPQNPQDLEGVARQLLAQHPEWTDEQLMLAMKPLLPPAPRTFVGGAIKEGVDLAKGAIAFGQLTPGDPLPPQMRLPIEVVKGMLGTAVGDVKRLGHSPYSGLAKVADIAGRAASMPIDVLSGGLASRIIDQGQAGFVEGDPEAKGRMALDALLAAIPVLGRGRSALRAGTQASASVPAAIPQAIPPPPPPAPPLGRLVRPAMTSTLPSPALETVMRQIIEDVRATRTTPTPMDPGTWSALNALKKYGAK
jgi:hypothetical protein